jgi:hypothetical protein
MSCDRCTGHCRQGRDCPRDVPTPSDMRVVRAILGMLAVFWVAILGAAVLARWGAL